MKYSPQVSILMPCFNQARFLGQAIRSVLSQDFGDFELLVSDDASIDNSWRVVQPFLGADSRVRYVRHEKNLGMVENWNWCLRQARGEYIKFLFGDDVLVDSRAISVMHATLKTNSSIKLVVSPRLIVDAHSRIDGVWNDLGRGGFYDGKKLAARCLLLERNLIGEPSTVMFRKADATRGFNQAYRQIVDLEMWMHLLRDGDLALTHDVLCAFRRHADQQSAHNLKVNLGEREHRLLADDYRNQFFLKKASFDDYRAAFRGVYYRKKKYHQSGLGVLPDEFKLGRFCYSWLWMIHRVVRPFENLSRTIQNFRYRRSHLDRQVVGAEMASDARSFVGI